MIAYVNGRFLPQDEATISIEDRSIIAGEAVFEVLRTYNGKALTLSHHLERLRRSLRYVEFDPDPIVTEIEDATRGVLERNADAISEVGDIAITQIVTRGKTSPILTSETPSPTTIVMTTKLDFAVFAPLFERGADLNVSLLTVPLGGSSDPRLKAANRIGNLRANLKGARMRPKGGGYWTLIFNNDGSIAETNVANLFIVSDGQLIHPPRHEILGGISLLVTCQLAKSLGIEVVERKITLYDLLNADETYITATTFCILPVASVDGISLMRHGDVGNRLLAAWKEHVELDFVAQAKQRSKSQAQAVTNAADAELAPIGR